MKFEFPVLIVLAGVGMMMMVSARDLIVALHRAGAAVAWRSTSSPPSAATRLRSTEAGLKYFVLGALSSGLLLYGASLTYGFAGTTPFDGIAQAIGRARLPTRRWCSAWSS